jgi:hypothetical protein
MIEMYKKLLKEKNVHDKDFKEGKLCAYEHCLRYYCDTNILTMEQQRMSNLREIEYF